MLDQAGLTDKQQKEVYSGYGAPPSTPSPAQGASGPPQLSSLLFSLSLLSWPIVFTLPAATTIHSPGTPESTFAGPPLHSSRVPTCFILDGSASDRLSQKRKELSSLPPSSPILCPILCKKNHIPHPPNQTPESHFQTFLLYSSGPTDPIALSHSHPVVIPISIVSSKDSPWEGLAF